MSLAKYHIHKSKLNHSKPQFTIFEHGAISTLKPYLTQIIRKETLMCSHRPSSNNFFLLVLMTYLYVFLLLVKDKGEEKRKKNINIHTSLTTAVRQ